MNKGMFRAAVAACIALGLSLGFVESPALAQAKKAPAKPAAPEPQAQPMPKIFVAATAGISIVRELLIPSEEGSYPVLSYDREILAEDPNYRGADIFAWSNANTDQPLMQSDMEAMFADAAAQGAKTIFLIGTDLTQVDLFYRKAAQRGVSMTVQSDPGNDPAYQALRAQAQDLENQLRTAESNMRMADQQRDAAAQAASQQAAAGGNPWSALGGLVGAVANDYGYGNYYRQAQSLRSQLSSVASQMRRLEAPKAATYYTADVERAHFFDAELGIYACVVVSRRCAYVSRTVALTAESKGPVASFKGEPTYENDPGLAPWTQFDKDVASKSAFGFTLAQLNGAADGLLLDIPLSGLAQRIRQDRAAFFDRVKLRNAALAEPHAAAIATLLPIANQLDGRNYRGRKFLGIFEAEHVKNAAAAAQQEAAEAKRKASLQGL